MGLVLAACSEYDTPRTKHEIPESALERPLASSEIALLVKLFNYRVNRGNIA